MTSFTDSLSAFVTAFETGASVIRAGFLQDTAYFALSDGQVGFVQENTLECFAVHSDGLLCAASDGAVLVTGGCDGAICQTDAQRIITKKGSTGGAWVDAVALKEGAVAWSAGRTVTVAEKGKEFIHYVPTTARGLAFAAKGFQLAIAHYNGVSVWLPRTQGAAKPFVWKGSHIDVTFSPDGRFLVTSMQENALHGWRIADGAHMRMSGYPSKSRSLSWSADGQVLATSGAEAAIVWPFAAKDGPMGKPPKELGVRPVRVSSVAFHPNAPVLAIGYGDGCVLLVRLDDGKELLVAPPREKGDPVTSIGWDKAGMRLVFGCEDGYAGLLSLPAV